MLVRKQCSNEGSVRVQLRLLGDSVPKEGSERVQPRLLGDSVPKEGRK